MAIRLLNEIKEVNARLVAKAETAAVDIMKGLRMKLSLSLAAILLTTNGALWSKDHVNVCFQQQKTGTTVVTFAQHVTMPSIDMTWGMGLDYDEFMRQLPKRTPPGVVFLTTRDSEGNETFEFVKSE